MLYKIIITKDGKKKKILYEGSNEDTAKEKYFTTVVFIVNNPFFVSPTFRDKVFQSSLHR